MIAASTSAIGMPMTGRGSFAPNSASTVAGKVELPTGMETGFLPNQDGGSPASWIPSKSSQISTARSTRHAEVTQSTREEYETVLLAEWDGYVLEMNEHSFFASLRGVHGLGVDGELEDAEIPLQDVSDSDLELLQLGAVFRLCVFHAVSRNGQPRRYTEVVFRRVAAYRPKALEAAKERAKVIFNNLCVD